MRGSSASQFHPDLLLRQRQLPAQIDTLRARHSHQPGIVRRQVVNRRDVPVREQRHTLLPALAGPAGFAVRSTGSPSPASGSPPPVDRPPAWPLPFPPGTRAPPRSVAARAARSTIIRAPTLRGTSMRTPALPPSAVASAHHHARLRQLRFRLANLLVIHLHVHPSSPLRPEPGAAARFPLPPGPARRPSSAPATPNSFRSTATPYSTSTVNCCASVFGW